MDEYCEDFLDPFDHEPDFNEGEEDDLEDENDSWDCAYPSECLMGYCDHMRHECYTVEDAEEMDGGI
jgi:hypothetical protein